MLEVYRILSLRMKMPFAFCGNARHPNGRGQMRLASARPTKHGVLPRVGEFQRAQLLDPHKVSESMYIRTGFRFFS